MKKIICIFIFICNVLYSLEFGYMGNQSFGMGGSGVAVSKSPWSAYYNPALQGVDSSIKFGLSVGDRAKVPNLQLDEKIDSILNIDQILNNINRIKAVFKNTVDSGIALQIPIPFVSDITSSIGLGVFNTTKTIIGISPINNGNNSISKYFNVDINTLSILEVPVSYALGFSTFLGDFYFGVAGKYMLSDHNIITSLTQKPFDSLFSKYLIRPSGVNTSFFGVDLGIAYRAPLDAIIIGVVGKNLNQPSINIKNDTHLKIESQYRLGIATGIIPYTTIAFDADIKPNNQFGFINDDVKQTALNGKTQMVSLGAMFNIGIFDIRAGLAKDMFASRDDWLISGGIGFTFIDIALYSSTKMSNIGDLKLPSNFGIKLGGGFTF